MFMNNTLETIEHMIIGWHVSTTMVILRDF